MGPVHPVGPVYPISPIRLKFQLLNNPEPPYISAFTINNRLSYEVIIPSTKFEVTAVFVALTRVPISNEVVPFARLTANGYNPNPTETVDVDVNP